MKYIIGVIIVLVLIGAGFWAGTKTNTSNKSTPTPSSSAIYVPPVSVVTVAPNSTYLATPALAISGEIGNRVGSRAPDFRLKNTQGNDVSLRDYLGREAVKLVFAVSGQLVLQPASVPQGITLNDPDDIVHRLYAVTSMPYTVNIDVNGIIR